MAGVRVKENEPIESAIRRFKKQCEKAGILAELRKREHYEKPSVRRKKKAMAARKRALRRASRSTVQRLHAAASRGGRREQRVNQVDALLLVLLTPFALRGFWRGFCRESFGLAGLLGGALAAAAGGSRLAAVLLGARLLPPVAA